MNGSTDMIPLHRRGRTIGVVWLLYFVVGILGAVLMRGIVVPGNASATATNLLAHATLFRAGLAFDLVANCLYIALTVLLSRIK